MKFFGFVLVHTVAKEDSEKCQTVDGLKTVELNNIANFIVEEPTTIENFAKGGNLHNLVVENLGKGVDLFVECLTLSCKEGCKVLKEGEHANKPISELIENGVIHLADHVANVIVIP